jgi:predicted metal-dependent phosphoesterase TrpH
MNLFKADLHIHTVLSPCGSLDMSPKVIVKTALQKGLDIIAITDHNSTRQCLGVTQAAAHSNLKVFLGVEVTTKEEIHCLAYFENFELLNCFQDYIDQYLPDYKNNADKFGYQVVVDADENIIYEESRLLITGLDQNINQIELKVRELNGIFNPPPINKPK